MNQGDVLTQFPSQREGRVLTTAMNKARSRFETVRGEMNEELPADIAVLEEAKRVRSYLGSALYSY
jgi:hypothetical protein